MAILTGILLGLSTLMFIGPVFFYLIKSTLEHNKKAGIAIAVGIIIGDIICVILALKGVGVFFENPENQKWLALFGGIILLGMGIKYIVKPSHNINRNGKFKAKSLWLYGVNGFLINFINPFVFAVWISFLSINKAKFNDESSVIISLTVTLITIFLTDCLKAIFAHKLKKLIKAERLKIMFKVFGIVMILFSVRLLYMVF
jgi:threonine/homoserine/homoserine lactone efflux protein